jgi:hypothetical protein
MYIPHPERAVVPAMIQLLMIGILAGALYAYGRSRCGHRAMIAALLVGELAAFLPLAFQMLVGLGDYGNTCRRFGSDYPDWFLVLVSHFELFDFAISSFICLLVSTLIAICLKSGRRRL